MEAISIPGLANKIVTEGDAYRFMEHLRWGDGTPPCPHCGDTERAYFLNPANGTSRKTRTGANSERRVWKCGACRKQFSVMTGTIFHGSKVSLRTWLFIIFEMCSSKNGIAAREVERKYGLTPKTAWFVTQRIREGMKRDPLVGMMRGTVVADETWIGGSLENDKRLHTKPVRLAPTEKRGSGGLWQNKTAVVSLVDTETGEVRSKVVPDVTGATLRKVIAEQVDMANTTLMTDEATTYATFSSEFAAHETVNHRQDEYVRYEGECVITSNAAENFFSQLKRSIDGTHHHVSRVHLDRYLAEFDFRHSTRKLSDTARMSKLMGQVEGRRLTYRPLTSGD